MTRVEELINYINLLQRLEREGYFIRHKVEEALDELHKEMGFAKKEEVVEPSDSELPFSEIEVRANRNTKPFVFGVDVSSVSFDVNSKNYIKSIVEEMTRNIKNHR